jgi:hypothetical protein
MGVYGTHSMVGGIHSALQTGKPFWLSPFSAPPW